MKRIIPTYPFLPVNLIILINIILIALIAGLLSQSTRQTEQFNKQLKLIRNIEYKMISAMEFHDENFSAEKSRIIEQELANIQHLNHQLAENLNQLNVRKPEYAELRNQTDQITILIGKIKNTQKTLINELKREDLISTLKELNRLFYSFERYNDMIESHLENIIYSFRKATTRNIYVILSLVGLLLFLVILQFYKYRKNRNSTEKKLVDSEAQYKYLVESTPDWLWEIDKEAVITFCSPSIEKILGYSPLYIQGKKLFEFMEDKEKAATKKLIYNAFQEKKGMEGLVQVMKHRNGQDVTLEINASPVFDKNNEITGFRGVGRDISHRKRIESELEEERSNMNALLNASHDAMALLSPDGKMLALNDTYASRFHKTKEELLHTDPREYIDRETLESRLTKVKEAIEKKVPVEFIDQRDQLILKNKLVPVFNSEKLSRLAVISRDITKETLAENQLKESEAMFSNFFYYNSAPMLLIDPANGKIMNANLSAAKFYGYTIEKLKKLSINKLNVRPVDEIEKEMVKALSKNKNHFFFEHKLACGTFKKVEVYSTPLTINGKKSLFSIIHDITERHKAQKALENSEEKFRQFFYNAPLGIFRSTLDGQFLEVNPEAARMFGYKEAEEVYRNVGNISEQIYAKPEDRGKIMSNILNTAKVQNLELLFRKVTGDTFHVNLIIYPVRNEKGSILYLEGIIQDITARKEMEEYIKSANTKLEKEVEKRTQQLFDINEELVSEIEEKKKAEIKLKSSQEFMDNLMNEIPDPIYVKDKEHKLIHINEAYANIFGKRKEELLGSTSFEIFPQKKAESIAHYDRLMFMSDRSVEKNEIIYDHQHQKRVYLTKTILSNKNTSNTMLIGIMRDITERKKTEDRMKENYQFQKTLLNTIPNPIFYKDTEGKYLGANKAFEELIGYKLEELNGKRADEISPVKLSAKYLEKDQELFTKGGYQTYEWKITNKKGEDRDVIFNKAAFSNAENEIGGILGVVTDITDRKKLERQILQEKERWRRSFISISEGIYLIDNEYNIIQCNETFGKIVGKKPGELIGKKLYTIIHGTEKPTSYCSSCKAIRSGKHHKGEFWEPHLNKYLYATADPVHNANGMLEFSINTLRDVTEEKKKEKALKESEEKFRKYVESSPIGIFVANKEGKYLDVNAAGLEMLNYTKEELLDRSIMDIIPFSEKEKVKTVFAILKKQKNSNHETKLITSEGEIIDVYINAVKLGDEKYLAYILDITDLKNTETELKKSENKFRKIIENSPDGIMLATMDGRIVEWNKAQEQITGMAKHNVANRRLIDVQHELGMRSKQTDHQNEELERYFKFLTKGNVPVHRINRMIEHKISREDKSSRVVQSKIFTIPSSDGFMIAAISQDITLKRKAMDTIKESERKLRAIFDNSNQMFIILDRMGFITAFNQSTVISAKELFKKEMKTGFSIYEIISEENKARFNKLINKTIKGKKSKTEVNTKDYKGIDHWFEFNFAPIEENHEVKGIFLNISEITERKKAEENIYSSLEREKELNQLKTRFISMVSHEFRTPLANIYSNTQLLEKFETKWAKEKKDRSFKRIFDSVKILNSMLDDVSLFGKKQSGKLQANPLPVEMDAFLKNVVDETLSNFSAERQVHIHADLKNKTAVLDKFLLRHTLTNLLNNALKYSKDKPVYVKMNQKNNNHIQIIIQDEGVGIPKKDLKYIFEPFFRSSNVENINGTGLGMAIVKHSTDLLNGKIKIKSELGKGTTVELLFPSNQNI